MNLQHVEIEYVAADGSVINRTFKRAYDVRFALNSPKPLNAIHIQEGTDILYIRNPESCVNVFSSQSVASTVSQWEHEEMDICCRTYCAEGKRISAIKRVREVMGFGLRECKEYVDKNFPI